MKKLIVLLLALVVVSGAFAQLTVTGYAKAKTDYQQKQFIGSTNADFTSNGINTNDPSTKVDGGVAQSYEYRLEFAGTDKDGNFGVKSRIQGNIAGTGTAAFPALMEIKKAEAWAKFAGGMVKVTGGKIFENSDYRITQDEANSQMGNVESGFKTSGVGFLAQVYPMAGLNLGLFMFPDADTLSGPQLKFAGSYAVEKLLTVTAAFNGKKSFDDLNGHISGTFVGVENLKATAGLKFTGKNTKDDLTGNGYTIVGYTMDKLFLEGAAEFGAMPDFAKAYYVEGNVEYTLDAYSIRGFVAYDKDIFNLGYKYDAVAGDAGDANTMKIGGEVSFPIGTGEFNLGANYCDKTGLEVPMYLKVVF